jgi:hypothetical protein
MAEASLNNYAPKGYEAISTGTKPISKINPVVVRPWMKLE